MMRNTTRFDFCNMLCIVVFLLTCRKVGVQVETISVLNASLCIACPMCSNLVPWCSPSKLAYKIYTALLNTVWMLIGMLSFAACNTLRDTQISQKSRSYLKILGARRVA